MPYRTIAQYVVVMPTGETMRYAPFTSRRAAVRVARWYRGTVIDRFTGEPIRPTRIERLVGFTNRPHPAT